MKKKKAKNYADRVWLNPKGCSSTGSIACFAGEANWSRGDTPDFEAFVEVADCSGKVRLHVCRFDKWTDYIKKVKKMRNSLDKYIEYCEKNPPKENT